MKKITELQSKYDKMKKEMYNLSNDIIQHLHDVYDSKLESFKTFEDFLIDKNKYARDTFGKLMYKKKKKNVFDKR